MHDMLHVFFGVMWCHVVWHMFTYASEEPVGSNFKVRDWDSRMETLVPIYQTTRRHVPKYCALDAHRCENLVSL